MHFPTWSQDVSIYNIERRQNPKDHTLNGKKGKVVPLLDTRNNIGGGFKNFRRNSLGKFTEIANVNTEIYTEILRRLRNMVRRKRHENRTTNHWVFSTTVLQHTRRFWSTISQQRIT